MQQTGIFTQLPAFIYIPILLLMILSQVTQAICWLPFVLLKTGGGGGGRKWWREVERGEGRVRLGCYNSFLLHLLQLLIFISKMNFIAKICWIRKWKHPKFSIQKITPLRWSNFANLARAYLLTSPPIKSVVNLVSRVFRTWSVRTLGTRLVSRDKAVKKAWQKVW